MLTTLLSALILITAPVDSPIKYELPNSSLLHSEYANSLDKLNQKIGHDDHIKFNGRNSVELHILNMESSPKSTIEQHHRSLYSNKKGLDKAPKKYHYGFNPGINFTIPLQNKN